MGYHSSKDTRKEKGIRMKLTPFIKIKPIRIHFNLDIDNDRVRDWQDCRPFDRKKQHISHTMEERIKKLPIVASPTSIQGEQYRTLEKIKDKFDKMQETPDKTISEQVAPLMSSQPLPHIMSKEAKETAPDARRLFLSTVKKYPGIIGEMERSQPKKVVVTSLRQPDKGMLIGWTSPTQEAYVGPSKPSFSKQMKKQTAKTTYHELKHVEQNLPTAQMMDQGEFDKPYLERPHEQEAIEYSEQKMKEYYKGRKPTGKEISKVLDLD